MLSPVLRWSRRVLRPYCWPVVQAVSGSELRVHDRGQVSSCPRHDTSNWGWLSVTSTAGVERLR